MATNHYHTVDFTRTVNGRETTYNSLEDWGLYLQEPAMVSPPKPNTYMIEVPGRNGSLDLTESTIGPVTFQDREIEFRFVCREKRKKWNEIYQKILNDIHGRNCTITCSDDPEYSYEGRVTVDEWGADEALAFPTVTATVRPFKTEKTLREYAVTLTTESEVNVRVDDTGSKPGMYIRHSGEGDAKKTTVIFGNTKVKVISWSLYTAIVVDYDKSGRKTSIAVSDSNGAGSGTSEQTTSTHYTWTLKKGSAAAKALTWDDIYKVTITGDISNLKVYGTLAANGTVTVDGSTKPAIPVFETNADITLTAAGEEYELASGSYYNEDIVIRNDPVTFAFKAKNALSGGETVTIRYRRGML